MWDKFNVLQDTNLVYQNQSKLWTCCEIHVCHISDSLTAPGTKTIHPICSAVLGLIRWAHAKRTNVWMVLCVSHTKEHDTYGWFLISSLFPHPRVIQLTILSLRGTNYPTTTLLHCGLRAKTRQGQGNGCSSPAAKKS